MPLRDNSRGGSEVIGCSVRGQKSVDKGVPCQDDNAKRALAGNRYIIAAADGLGSASLSHVGSDTATQAVTDYLEDAVAGIGPLDEETLLPMLREAFVHAREQLHRKAESLGESVSALNTTLLVAVGGPNGVGGAAVGDGGVVLYRGGQTGLVVSREETEYENETIPLQNDSWDQSYRSRWVADADAAAVFSDGLDGVTWSGPASVSDELFDQVFSSLREYSDFDELEAFLEEFLDGESLRRSSRDDKTLVVGTIPVALWTDPAEAAPIDNPSVTPSETGSAQGGRSATAGSQPTGQRLNDVRGEQTVTSGRLGGNPNRRRRRIVSLAGIGVVVLLVGVLAATLFLGSSGNSVDGIDVSTAELQGAEGLIVEGTVNGTRNATLNVSVWEGERDNGTPLISEQKQVNSERFSLQLPPDELETKKKQFDYYGETEYEVVVEAADGTNSTDSLERGDLHLAFTGQNVTVTDSEIRGSGTLTQGGQPVHEDEKLEVTYGAGSGLDVEYHSSNATFQFSGKKDLSPGTDITATFADRTETVTTAEFEVTSLTLPDGQIFEGDSIRVEYEVENTGDIEASREVTLSVGSLTESESVSEEVTLDGGESQNRILPIQTSEDAAGEYTATVNSGDSSKSETVHVLAPVEFTVEIVETEHTDGQLDVTADIENTGDVEGNQTVEMRTGGDIGSDETEVEVPGRGLRTAMFTVDTSPEDVGKYNVTVTSDSDSASSQVTVPGGFAVDIVRTNAPAAGDVIEVRAEISNTDNESDRQTIEMTTDANIGNNETGVELDRNESTTETFTIETNSTDSGEYNITVESEDSEDDASVDVVELGGFAIEIVEMTRTIEGDEGEINVSVENTGEESVTQNISLNIRDGQEPLDMNSTNVTLDGNESRDVSLGFETETDDAGEYTATVSSDNGTARTELSVLEPANFTVDIDSTNLSVVEGDDLQVTAIIENTGDLDDNQTLQLDVADLGNINESVSLNSGESSQKTFSVDTGSGDTGNYTAQVASKDDTARTDVRVDAPANFTVNITSDEIKGPEGSTVTVSYEVTNTGDVQGTQTIEFVVNGTAENNESEVILNGSENFSSNFSYDTMEDDTPAVTVTVSSDNDSATETVPVQGPGESGGGGSSSEGSGDSEDDSQTLSASNEGTIVVTNTVSHGRQAGTTATGSSGRQNRGQAWHPGDGSTSVGTKGA